MDHNRQSDLHRTIAPLRGKIDGGKERRRERATEGKSDRGMEKRSDSLCPSIPLSLRHSFPLSLCLSLALLAGCSHTVTEAEKKAAVDEFFASARSCWPS